MSKISIGCRIPVLLLIFSLGLHVPAAVADSRPANAGIGTKAEPGRPLAADGAVRIGMDAMASLLRSQWGAIKRAELQHPAYLELAGKMEARLSDMDRSRQLDPAAEKTFHEIRMDMKRALELMRSQKVDLQRAGALALAQAMRNYGRYFDHPGWSPPD